MVMHRGNRLAVHPGDGASFDDVHLQVRVQSGKLENHPVVFVPVTIRNPHTGRNLAPNDIMFLGKAMVTRRGNAGTIASRQHAK